MKNESKILNKVPFAVVCDDDGNIYEDTSLEAVGRTGNEIVILNPDDFIELPDGSDFFLLKDRLALGYDKRIKKIRTSKKGHAASAFIAPTYTQTHIAAYENTEFSPRLPLYAYSVLGWLNDKFYTAAIKVDDDIRQDCTQFNQNIIVKKANYAIKKNKSNRLLKHIHNCATEYFCPAARNYFMNRWEAPLPTSPSCNSKCLGCISYQPKKHQIVSTQNRITFVPTPEEIAEIAINHLETAPRPIVSFGQGCEGEPLMVWEIINESIKLIRKKTSKGIINLNTNGSNQFAVQKLCESGIDSFRISINSVREKYYNAYYKPVKYSFSDVVESIKIARKFNKWVSINYFIFPGFTDSVEEFELLKDFINGTNINMIQWRNFNIDPDWFYSEIQVEESEKLGIKNIFSEINKPFPNLYNGYFNPPQEIIKKYLKSI